MARRPAALVGAGRFAGDGGAAAGFNRHRARLAHAAQSPSPAAGTDAGNSFNTFPLMNNNFIPDLTKKVPLILNEKVVIDKIIVHD